MLILSKFWVLDMRGSRWLEMNRHRCSLLYLEALECRVFDVATLSRYFISRSYCQFYRGGSLAYMHEASFIFLTLHLRNSFVLWQILRTHLLVYVSFLASFKCRTEALWVCTSVFRIFFSNWIFLYVAIPFVCV